jgi:hypothetical protein
LIINDSDRGGGSGSGSGSYHISLSKDNIERNCFWYTLAFPGGSRQQVLVAFIAIRLIIQYAVSQLLATFVLMMAMVLIVAAFPHFFCKFCLR